MNRLLQHVSALVAPAVVGAALGITVAYLRTRTPPSLAGRGPGAWRMMNGIGDERMTPLQRAALARTGIWALPDREVIYFVAESDDVGATLDPASSYELAGGGDPPCRWWSVSAYKDFFWFDNPEDRYSYSKTTVARDAEGGYRISVGPQSRGANWLPTAGAGRLTLLFRLYQPDPTLLENPDRAPLPSIRKVR